MFVLISVVLYSTETACSPGEAATRRQGDDDTRRHWNNVHSCITGAVWNYVYLGRDLFTPNWGTVFILSFDVAGEEFFVGSPSFLHFPGWITGILFFCFFGVFKFY